MDNNINFEPSKLSFRTATVEDYKDILDIFGQGADGVWDYIPAMYFHFHHNPRHLQFVAEYNGEIIGYRGCLIVDGGHTYLGLSARTKPGYESRGVSDRLAKFARKCLFEKHPSVQLCRWVMRDTEKGRRFIKQNPRNFILSTFNYLVYEIHSLKLVNSLPLLKQTCQLSLVQDLSFQEIFDIATSIPSIENLQRYGKYILAGAFLPYKLDAQNMSRIVKNYHCCISIVSGHQNEKKICQVFSSMSTFMLPDKYRMCEIYYNGYPDIEVWKAHIVNHLLHLIEKAPMEKGFRFMFQFPNEIPSTEAKDFLSTAFGDRAAADIHPTTSGILGQTYPIFSHL